MAKIPIEEVIRNADIGDMNYNDLLKYYRRMAKVADQRLVALESYSHDKYYGGILNYAHKGAMHDLAKWGEGHRFNTKPPENVNSLRAKIKDIEKFILSETSTKGGIRNTYIKKANTVNERFGTKFTWQQLANYYINGMNEKMDRMFGSRTALKVIGQLQAQPKKVRDAIKQADEKVEFKDEITPAFREYEVRNAISKYGIDMKDFIK